MELVSAALSDGDLEAALAQYERQARLVPWSGGDEAPGPGQDSPDALRDTLASLMSLRIPLSVRVREVLAAGDLVLLVGERRLTGTGPRSERVELSGTGATLVRRQPGGAWRIVADAWGLTGSPRSPLASGESPRADREPLV